MIKVSVKTGNKILSSLEIPRSLGFFTFVFHIVFKTCYSFCESGGVAVLLTSAWEGSSGAELQLAWWPAIVAVQLKKSNLLVKCKWTLL